MKKIFKIEQKGLTILMRSESMEKAEEICREEFNGNFSIEEIGLESALLSVFAELKNGGGEFLAIDFITGEDDSYVMSATADKIETARWKKVREIENEIAELEKMKKEILG